MLLNSPLEVDRLKSNNLDLKKFKDEWCRFVIHQLAINCKTSSDIFRNDVRFVTFNYDVSLVWALHQGLRYIQLFRLFRDFWGEIGVEALILLNASSD